MLRSRAAAGRPALLGLPLLSDHFPDHSSAASSSPAPACSSRCLPAIEVCTIEFLLLSFISLVFFYFPYPFLPPFFSFSLSEEAASSIDRPAASVRFLDMDSMLRRQFSNQLVV